MHKSLKKLLINQNQSLKWEKSAKKIAFPLICFGFAYLFGSPDFTQNDVFEILFFIGADC